jgi:hypothetical protein
MKGGIHMAESPKYDYRKLRGRIKEVLGTEGEYAKKINRSHNYLSSVFAGTSYFTQKDITQGADVLAIPENDIGAFYFAKQVHENGTFEQPVQ